MLQFFHRWLFTLNIDFQCLLNHLNLNQRAEYFYSFPLSDHQWSLILEYSHSERKLLLQFLSSTNN
jgi:hypothetical protein